MSLTSPSPPASTPAKLTVNILDVNDNTPRFKPFGITYYTEKVLEGATPGTTLIAVSAVDPDKGLNGLITYSLLDLMPPGYVQLEDSSAGRAGGRVCACHPPKGTMAHFSPSRCGPTMAPQWAGPEPIWPVFLPDAQTRGKDNMLCPRLGWKAPLRSAGNLEYSTTISLHHPSFHYSCPLVSKGDWFQDFPRGTKMYGCSSPIVSLPSIYTVSYPQIQPTAD